MAKTGETRKTKQPLKIDRLPASVHDAILHLRNTAGKTWEEIEARSTEKYSKDWQSDGGGFVDWDEVSVGVLELFPDMKLGHSLLHRWYDLRVTQVQRDVLLRSRQAQVIAREFVKANLVNDEQGVINAARDTLMGILAEDGTAKGRKGAAAGLIELGNLMQKARTNRIRERKVAVDEQTLEAKLDQIKRKAGDLLKDAEGKDATGAPAMSREDVLRSVKEIYGVA